MKAKSKGTAERKQGKPPGQTGANKPMPAGRDFRKTAPKPAVKSKTNQKDARP